MHAHTLTAPSPSPTPSPTSPPTHQPSLKPGYYIPVTSATASSEFSAGYSASKPFVLSQPSDWASNGQGVGSWIKADFGGSWNIISIGITQRSSLQEMNKGIRVTFSDDSSQSFELAQIYTQQIFNLQPAVQSSSVKISVTSVYGTINNGFHHLVFEGETCRHQSRPLCRHVYKHVFRHVCRYMWRHVQSQTSIHSAVAGYCSE